MRTILDTGKHTLQTHHDENSTGNEPEITNLTDEFMVMSNEEKFDVIQKMNKDIALFKENITSLKEQIGLLEKITQEPEEMKLFSKTVTEKIDQAMDDFFEQEMKASKERQQKQMQENRVKLDDVKSRIHNQQVNAFFMLDRIEEKLQEVQEAVAANKEDPVAQTDDAQELDLDLDDLLLQMRKSMKGKDSVEEEPVMEKTTFLTETDQEDPLPETQEEPIIERMEKEEKRVIDGFWEKSATESSVEHSQPVTKKNDGNTSGNKYAYVVNKVAGEDLFDKNGKLIIAKNEYITEAIIHKAEAEGKFVALVVNMKLKPHYES